MWLFWTLLNIDNHFWTLSQQIFCLLLYDILETFQVSLSLVEYVSTLSCMLLSVWPSCQMWPDCPKSLFGGDHWLKLQKVCPYFWKGWKLWRKWPFFLPPPKNVFSKHKHCKFLCLHIWAAAQINYLNSCRSRFSGVCLVFQVFRGIWHSDKENPSVSWSAALSCPLMASNYANSHLLPISFWSRSGCWPFLGFFILSRFTGVYLVLQCFRQKWRTPIFALFA